jgi:hypothetical protein
VHGDIAACRANNTVSVSHLEKIYILDGGPAIESIASLRFGRFKAVSEEESDLAKTPPMSSCIKINTLPRKVFF